MPEATPGSIRLTNAGLWLIPLYALLLALSTITHEPDHGTDFTAWSRYVTTDLFVVSHLVGSILGASLGIVGVAAALLLLARGPAAVQAMVGVALTIVGNVLFTAMFGAAAFAQPAIGRAFLAGGSGMRAFYDDVYGMPLLVTFAVGALSFIAGAIAFGSAVARTSRELRWAGYGYGLALALFPVTGFTVSALQPVAGAAAAVAGVALAVRLPRVVASRAGEMRQGRVPLSGA